MGSAFLKSLMKNINELAAIAASAIRTEIVTPERNSYSIKNKRSKVAKIYYNSNSI